MSKRIIVTLMALAIAGLGARAAGFAEGRTFTGKLTLTGSSTVAPLAAEIGKRFEKRHPGVRVDVQTGGSSRGVSDVRSGAADIGLVSRALGPEETDLNSHTIALDGVCVILNAANPVARLSDEQVAGIFTGKITNWREVGGADAPVTVVNKAEGRSTLELFIHYYRLKNSDIKAHVVIGDNEQGVKTVAGNRNSIGYVSIGTAEYDAAAGVPIKLLPMNGVAASLENVRNRSFPISRPLNLVTRGEPSSLSKGFLNFAVSSAVADLVTEQYFVSIAKK